MNLDDFNYELPVELIAQTPTNQRDHSKLMVLDKVNQSISHTHFYDLPNWLKPGDVLVFNNTKVLKARLFAKRKTGAKIELFLLTPRQDGVWEAMIYPARRVKDGEILEFDEQAQIQIVQKYVAEQIHLIKFLTDKPVNELIEKLGQVPLPPYIHTDPTKYEQRYQTVFAQDLGSVAAPTAGLHFTDELLNQLRAKGVEICFVTLHVGLGTFLPIKVEDITQHKMHTEAFSISQEVAQKLNLAKQQQQRIIAVGTTVARVLESVCQNNIFEETQGQTSIFIYPGYKFKAVSALITNFHLPKSTLLLLVSAFASKEFIRKAYQIAIEQQYRFFSFGDGMMILTCQ